MKVSAYPQYQRQHIQAADNTHLSGSSITNKDKLEGRN
jgi:hypothetical protein